MSSDNVFPSGNFKKESDEKQLRESVSELLLLAVHPVTALVMVGKNKPEALYEAI